MTVNGLHLLQTYQCIFSCDHCFVHGSPEAKGVMTISSIGKILEEAKEVGSIDWIYFEGGEPFLYYQTLICGLQNAKSHGFKIGIVTNSYWATSVEDAKEWLAPILEIGISDLSISDDPYHYGENETNLADNAFKAAKELGLPASRISIKDPRKYLSEMAWKGKPVVEGRVLFKGRAVEKLTEGLPRRNWSEFNKCLNEDFSNQTRVHVDPFGHVHVCQGISIGNIQGSSLKELLIKFSPEKHPILSPIIRGGPAELVREYNVEHEEGYVDECHLCYATRLKLRSRFPDILTPDQMYGT